MGLGYFPISLFGDRMGIFVESLCAYALQLLLWQPSSSQTLAKADGELWLVLLILVRKWSTILSGQNAVWKSL